MLGRVVIALAVAATACGDQTKPSRPPIAVAPGPALAGSSAATPMATATPAAATPTDTAPPLAGAPVIDLIANRFRWHLHGPGLVMPIASEGLRKYTQEYAQPWGKVVEVDGKRGRVLDARSATLRFPSDADAERVLHVRVHGMTKQRFSLRLNGKSAGTMEASAGWQVLSRSVTVRAGENELVISASKKGSAGGATGYGLFHSLALATAEPAADAAWPPLSPVAQVEIGGDARPALTGYTAMALYLEVPRAASLVVDTGTRTAGTHLQITARPIDGEPVTLLEAAQPANAWTPHRISLAALGGKVVRLELASDGDVAWANAKIALAQTPVAPHPAPYKNAILFVVDALRADRLAAYGQTRVRTPRITGAAERGVVFLNNQAASPSSPPSHASIQTGMIPRVHGVTGDRAQLRPDTPLLSAQLVDAGIAAVYVGNNVFGMGRLEKAGRWTAYHVPVREGLGIDCSAIIPLMLKMADAQTAAGKRFFISALPFEPHVPYRYHPDITDHYFAGPWDSKIGKSIRGEQLGGFGKHGLSERGMAQVSGLYDGEVEYLDGCFGALLDGLAERGLADSTAVILTSDHGEGMREHGRMGHAFGHYAELANVPLVVIAPDLVAKGRAIETVTSHVDIVPTILDLLGVPRAPQIQGQSLVPLMLRDGPALPRVMPLEYGRSYALRGTRWKYIVGYGGTESVYDLATDPTEQHDLAATHPHALRYLRDVAGFFLAHRSDWHMETWGTFDNHAPAFVEAMQP